MANNVEASGGVAGTVGAFNFIRRIGFPSTPEVLSIFTTICVVSAILALPLAGLSLGPTLMFATFVIIAPAVVGELLNSRLLLRGNRVLTFRRLLGLETLSWCTLILLLPISALIGLWADIPSLWIDGFLLALILSLPSRFLSLVSILSLAAWKKMLGAMVVPVITLAAFSVVLPSHSLTGISILLLGSVLSIVGVSLLVRSIDRAGIPEIGDSPMGLFRAFLEHWLRCEPKSLEDRLISLGTRGVIETSILGFSGADTKTKGCIIVSNFHPGPYRDLGSSGLPSRLKQAVEATVGGVAQVPHGISSHQLNIISSEDIEKILSEARIRYPSDPTTRKASPLVRVNNGEAKVTAQAFGNIALLTLTLAPYDMEDMPVEVLNGIETAAVARGVDAIVVDAHNSQSSQTSITANQAQKLVEAANEALNSLSATQQVPFKVGVAQDSLSEFGLEDGIGPGGLSVLTIGTNGQLVAYITIDGNNMQTGLRNILLESLKEIGIADGEIMTTDTHLVTGLARSPLGYYPVGAHVDKDLLIRKVKETVHFAVQDMEDAAVGVSKFKLDLWVLGSETFQAITSFVARIGKRVVRFFYSVEVVSLAVALVIFTVM